MSKDVVYVRTRHRSAQVVSVFRTKNLARIAEKVVNALTHLAMARAGRGTGNNLGIVRNPKMKAKGNYSHIHSHHQHHPHLRFGKI